MTDSRSSPVSTWIALGIIAYLAYQTLRGGGTAPAPLPPAPPGPDLVAVFRETDDLTAARAHCRAFGCLCGEMAGRIEFDGQRSNPKLVNGVQFDELRIDMRQSMFDGKSLALAYPRLPEALRAHFNPRVGVEGDTVTPEQRAKWVTAYRELAAAAEHAAGRL